VVHRKEKVSNLIHDIEAHKDMITAYKDINNASILHLAGIVAPVDKLNVISGQPFRCSDEYLSL
jgi:hypothetical protein